MSSKMFGWWTRSRFVTIFHIGASPPIVLIVTRKDRYVWTLNHPMLDTDDWNTIFNCTSKSFTIYLILIPLNCFNFLLLIAKSSLSRILNFGNKFTAIKTFSNRAVDCWSSLPNELFSSGSVPASSRALKEMELTNVIKGMSSEACDHVLAFLIG